MLAQKLARSLSARSASAPWMRYLNSSCSNGSNAAGSAIAASTTNVTRRSLGSKSHDWIPDVKMDTDIVHGGVVPDDKTGAILTPVYLSTTFVQESVDKYLEKGYSYSRTNNPTVKALEEKVAKIENGYDSICVSTGMAATASCIQAFMGSGDHCVITNCSYGGTNRICREQFVPMGMEFDFVDFTDPATVEAAIKPNTKLIFSESPTNPTLTLADLDAISAIAKKHGIIHVCDSTFATPYV